MNIYETQKLVSEYLLFHYASSAEMAGVLPLPEQHLHFAKRTVWEMLPGGFPPVQRALDLGCAVGRSSFELSQRAAEVLGIDYSHAFVQAAQALAAGAQLEYHRLEEGHVSTPLKAQRPDDCHPQRVSFEQGDAQALRDDIGSFDLLHAANLLCRLPDPSKLLARLPQLVNPGGWLILTTPCTWLEEFTPKQCWPAGSTLEWLKHTLEPHFTLVSEKNLPFVIRETARKFQWTSALGTLWQRKA